MQASILLIVTLHLAASLVLAGFGFHRLLLATRYLRFVRQLGRRDPMLPSRLPRVTVQLPLYNERYVAERAVRAAAALDYPRSLLQIQVLDDSTDETTGAVARVVEELREQGFDIHHVHRASRDGFKAGALANGLTSARGTLIAILDADFIPRRDFLVRTVGEFDDPSVGLVQARWEHINAHTSLLTRAQAVQLDAHFTIEHGVRAATRCFFNFNGTAGIWRRRAIEAAGGWNADTLTEDLDLSYRAQLAGWRFVYRDDIGVPSELPVEVAAYRIQQQRWAQGGVQTARKVLPAIMRAPLPGRVKWEAFWHLAGHFTYPLVVVLALAGLLVTWAAGPVQRSWVVAVDGTLLLFATIALSVFYGAAAQARSRSGFARCLPIVPVIMVLGAGIALGQTAAIYRGLRQRATPFRRTPKYRLGRARDSSWRSAAYRISASRVALAECGIGLTVLAAGLLPIFTGVAVPSGMGLFLGSGSLAVGASVLTQRRGIPSCISAGTDQPIAPRITAR
jgi:cellulose synthase/poly-beta-1,6-N-acetylglucosamine synthase-like glycosyltransferase